MTEIRGPVHPVLLSGKLQRERVIIVIYTGSHGTRYPLQQIRKILPVMNPSSKIQLAHMPVGKNGHDITDLLVKQMKCLCFLIE